MKFKDTNAILISSNNKEFLRKLEVLFKDGDFLHAALVQLFDAKPSVVSKWLEDFEVNETLNLDFEEKHGK